MGSRDCNSCSNLLRRDGTSQQQRFFTEQDPSYVKIDERSYLDLVRFAIDFSQKVQFWDVLNQRSGDWNNFMLNSQASLFSEIHAFDLNGLEELFNQSFDGDYSSDAEARTRLTEMFSLTLQLAQKLDGWLSEIGTDLQLHEDLQLIISRSGIPMLKSIINYDKTAVTAYNNATPTPVDAPIVTDTISNIDYDSLSDFWSVDVADISGDSIIYGDVSILSSTSFSERVESGKTQIRVAFRSVMDMVTALKLSAEKNFDELLTDYGKHESHFGLYLAFLQLFRFAQDHINELTDRHMDFYYRDVLQLSEKDATPDNIHLVFEPARGVEQKRVSEGTSISAGTDNTGVDITFTTDEEIVINQAKVSNVQSVFLDRGLNSQYIQTIYHNTNADSFDGKGKAFPDGEPSWEPFGKRQVKDNSIIENRTMDTARVGFSIASPEFRLSEGFRIVRLSLHTSQSGYEELLNDNLVESGTTKVGKLAKFLAVNPDLFPNEGNLSHEDRVAKLLAKWLKFRFTGDKGWVEPDNLVSDDRLPKISFSTEPPIEGITGFFINVEMYLSQDIDPIVGYDQSVHEQNYDTQWPVLEILTNQSILSREGNDWMFGYEFLKDLEIRGYRIDCEVKGLVNLNVANDQGSVDPAKPFMPFTSNPQKGSNFYIGSAEAFSKKLINMELNLDWKGVPNGDLIKHYENYILPKSVLNIGALGLSFADNSYFKAELKILDEYQWKDLCLHDDYTLQQDGESQNPKGDEGTEIGDSNDNGNNDGVSQGPGDLIEVEDPDAIDVDPGGGGFNTGGTGVVVGGGAGNFGGGGFFFDAESNTEFNSGANKGGLINFLLMALGSFSNANNEYNKSIYHYPIRRTLTTHNYVNLFRSGEDIDKGIRPSTDYEDFVENKSNSEDKNASLPRTLIVESKEHGVPYANHACSFDLLTNDDFQYSRDESLTELGDYEGTLKRGYVKLELLKDFFHAQYPKRLAQQALQNKSGELPNPPYTPELHKVTLDYISTHEVIYSGTVDSVKWEDRVEQFYHVTPVGEVEVFPTQSEKSISDEAGDIYYADTLLPKLYLDGNDINTEGRLSSKIDIDTGRSVDIQIEETDEGILYLGIEDLVVPQSLSLLFQFREGTEDNDLEVPAVEWSYLSNDQWVGFKTTEIVSDETKGMVHSGVVKFSMPEEATNDNQLFNSNGMHWLRVRVIGNTESFSNLIGVHAQAVKATYLDNGNDPYRLNTEITGGTVSGLVTSDFEVKKVNQPYDSFNGRIQEQSAEFYARVAERLRHKGRGITVRDYEHLVLEEYPEIYKVKCINHTSKYSEYSPGDVSVVVIPYFKNQNERNPFELKVSKSKLLNIRSFLVERNSPFANLDVRNPKYESVRVLFGVEFNIGYDRTFYENQLNEDIKRFISPWAFGEDEEIIFGGSINRSIILNFIEEREYVDYVTNFQMFHKIGENRAEEDVFVAEATTASSVLVTALEHTILPASCDPFVFSSGVNNSYDEDSFDNEAYN